MYARSHHARVRYAREEVTGPPPLTVTTQAAFGEGFATGGKLPVWVVSTPGIGSGHVTSPGTPLPITVVTGPASGGSGVPAPTFVVRLIAPVAWGHGFVPGGNPVTPGAGVVVQAQASHGSGHAPTSTSLLDLRLGGWTLDLSQSWGFGLDADMDVSTESDVEAIADGAQIQRVSETYPTPTLSNGRPT